MRKQIPRCSGVSPKSGLVVKIIWATSCFTKYPGLLREEEVDQLQNDDDKDDNESYYDNGDDGDDDDNDDDDDDNEMVMMAMLRCHWMQISKARRQKLSPRF